MTLKEALEINKNRIERTLIYLPIELDKNPSLIWSTLKEDEAVRLIVEYNKQNPFIQFDMDGNKR